ncbi:MAG: peptidoglycan DD-metalloendopeptidase family protein [Deltaproteobacteria bacterium]|nr:peptidoglycan DD-metalloendopeptidase family protein [Deltaproteobacteria bacterium]
MNSGRRIAGVVLQAAAFLIFLLTPLAHAAETTKELEGIRKKIAKEKQEIAKVRKKEGSVLQSLEKIEVALEKKNQDLKRVNSRLESILADLQKREEEAEKIGLSLKARRELLKRRARALYRWQRGGSPFVLLNGSLSVAELMQRKRYLELTVGYDQDLVQFLRGESLRQEAVRKELARKREDVDEQRKALVGIKESIRSEREKKKELLASLGREKDARVRALRELEQAALRLQKMMDEISRKSVAPPVPAGVGFEAMRGKLDFPARGEVMGGFGRTRHPEFSAELFRKGIDIEAPIGEEIRAVDTGRVVFADRFSGYGKMMIIDHGQRYYSVYAHLSDLMKKTGEPVQRGEPIGLVGDSDSLAGARLYFEIRKDGRPIDPLPWFRKR